MIRKIVLRVCFVLAILAAFVPFFASADFEDGLVLYFPLDENSGDKAADLSGFGHDGDIDNPEWVDGMFGSALHFNGEPSLSYVTVDSTDELNVNEMTFMAWILPESWDGVRQIVGKSVHGGCGGRTQYGIFSENSAFVLRFETVAGRSNITTDLPPIDEWTHVAATNDGAEAKIYFDGEEAVAAGVAGELNVNDDPWRLGQDCERLNYIFMGVIDEARLWNRALSADEIGEFMGKGAEVLAVDPQGKAAATWGQLKSRN